LHDQGAESGASADVALELVSVQTGDGRRTRWRALPAARRQLAREAALSAGPWDALEFLSGPSRWIAPMLAGRGYDCLALNLRDHDSTEPQSLHDAFQDLGQASIGCCARD
jgi:hypothetical protein